MHKFRNDQDFLDWFQSQSPAHRCAMLTRVGREDLESTINHRKETNDWRERFNAQLDSWFNRLRGFMKDYKISKDELSANGLDYNDCVKFYYSHRG